MKKQILNLGNKLSKMEKKSISGGYDSVNSDDKGKLCYSNSECSSGACKKKGLRPILGICS
ncbi:hypothetical protein [Tenacibaculum sp. SDUM215027]|uniref:hypothetical protein n=1 Tax=Tenacibaculum sp. SDUM215027 TaxID=3422596 RepID=UPI003D31E135